MKKMIIAGLIFGLVSLTIGYNIGRIPVASKALPVSKFTPALRKVMNEPRVSTKETQTQRETRFANLNTIAQTLTLTSEFDQTEALYVIAGRSDVSNLIKLIKQASQIASVSDRKGALGILFSRLVQLDPHMAVDLAGQPALEGYTYVESTIWRGWSRTNLEQALAAAVLLAPQARKNKAAQEMYWAHGIYNTLQTKRIEEVLNIPPSR